MNALQSLKPGGIPILIIIPFLLPAVNLKAQDCLLDSQVQVIEGCGTASAPPAHNMIDDVFGNLPTPQAAWIMLVAEEESGEPCINGLEYNRTYSLIDDLNGNGSQDLGEPAFTCAEHFLIADHLPPVFLSVPTNIIAECQPNLPEVVVDNPCGDVEVIVTELGFIAPCNPDAPGFNRLWTAVDGCGNVTEVSQMLYVRDTQGPILAGVPADTCGIAGPPPNVTAFDVCEDDYVNVFFNEQTETGPCGLTVKRTWAAEDHCGFLSTAAQRISPLDTLPPNLLFVAPDLTSVSNGEEIIMECDGMPPPQYDVTAILVSDDCSTQPELHFERTLLSAGNCPVDGYLEKYRYSWTATDDCGNVSELYFDLKIVDHTPPQLLNIPDYVQLYCSQNVPPMANVLPADNCDVSNFTFNEYQFYYSPEHSSVLRQWKAEDGCGNKTVKVQSILLEESLINGVFQTLDTVYCQSSNNVMTITPSGGSPPYAYDWLLLDGDGAFTSNSHNQWVVFSAGSSPITMSVMVTDQHGCTSTLFTSVSCLPQLQNPPGQLLSADDVNDIALFPNPATSVAFLTLDHPALTSGKLYVLNPLGTVIREDAIPPESTSAIEIAVDDLPAGIYSVWVRWDNGKSILKRLTVMQ